MRGCYLDASALVKLAIRETETDALRDHLKPYASRATSRVAAVEVPRALARRGPQSVSVGRDSVAKALDGIMIVELHGAITSAAAVLEPETLRSVDAIHLASALSIRDELDAFITYDLGMADAARAVGLTVVMPGIAESG